LQTNDVRARVILAKVYASQYTEGQSSVEFLARAAATDLAHVLVELEDLQKLGWIEWASGRPLLTASGRKKIIVVMAGGAFDILHPGHIETLEQARSLGDVLVVSVARDSTFERNKKRKPQHGEELRRNLVSAVRAVDLAVLGSETDIFETVELLKPDIIALGYDQFHEESMITEEAKRRGVTVRVIRLKSSNPGIKTSSLINSDAQSRSGL
jgi:cytidyltransferase-like protein